MNSVKDEAVRIIDSLEEEVNMEEIIYALAIRSKLLKAEKDIKNNRVISQEEVEKKFNQWLE